MTGFKILRLLRKGKIPDNKKIGRFVNVYGYLASICFGVFSSATLIRYCIKIFRYFKAKIAPYHTFRHKLSREQAELFNLKADDAKYGYDQIERIFSSQEQERE